MSSSRQKNGMSIKHLESYLQDLDEFDRPKIELEQYATPPHIAALMLNTIDVTYNDLKDKFIADLGCGTGRLAVGSLLCGASLVVGFDIDHDALKCGLQNINDMFDDEENDESDIGSKVYRACTNFNYIQADVASSECDNFWDQMQKKFDTVIMNPPFGTKNNQGLDMIFLKRAIDLSQDVVYSLHKTSTRDYIMKRASQWNVKAKPVAQIRYNLNNTYRFHKKKSVDIEVDLWRVKCN